MEQTLSDKTPERLRKAEVILAQMDDIEYGYLDKNGVVHRESDDDFDQAEFGNYRLQTHKQVAHTRVGVCWDQVEYARHLFTEAGVPTTTYAIAYYDYEGNNYFNHTILVFEDAGRYYWFEHALQYFAGIHEFLSERELLLKFKEEFLLTNQKNIPQEYKKERLRMWRYTAPQPGSAPVEVFRTWECGEGIIGA